MENFIFSQDFLRALVTDLEKVLKNPNNFMLSFNKDDLLKDEDVAEILCLCVRQIRTFRKQEKIRSFKIGGRVMYFRLFLYIDLLKLFCEQNEK